MAAEQAAIDTTLQPSNNTVTSETYSSIVIKQKHQNQFRQDWTSRKERTFTFYQLASTEPQQDVIIDSIQSLFKEPSHDIIQRVQRDTRHRSRYYVVFSSLKYVSYLVKNGITIAGQRIRGTIEKQKERNKRITHLYIPNFPAWGEEEDLKEIMKNYGKIKYIKEKRSQRYNIPIGGWNIGLTDVKKIPEEIEFDNDIIKVINFIEDTNNQTTNEQPRIQNVLPTPDKEDKQPIQKEQPTPVMEEEEQTTEKDIDLELIKQDLIVSSDSEDEENVHPDAIHTTEAINAFKSVMDGGYYYRKRKTKIYRRLTKQKFKLVPENEQLYKIINFLKENVQYYIGKKKKTLIICDPKTGKDYDVVAIDSENPGKLRFFTL